jgi:dimeric dUTPase (all-alpha-NTP-PPase superfamily)
MDKLEYLLDRQENLRNMYENKRPEYKDMSLNDLLVIFSDAIIDECSELKAGLNWKPWKNNKPLDHDYLKEELIDILHFWLDACSRLDMNAREIIDIYDSKHYENERRQIDGGKEKRDAYITGK